MRTNLNEPLPGATIEYRAAAGPHPPAFTTRTGANGNARIQAFASDSGGFFWITGDGIASVDTDVPDSLREPGPVVLWTSPGVTFSGQLLDHDGQPIVGALLAGTVWHRGPWTRTNADGRFKLVGLSHGERVTVRLPEQTRSSPTQWTYALPHGESAVLRPSGLLSRGSKTKPLYVSITTGDGRPASAVVTAWRLKDGMCGASATGHHGVKPGDAHKLHLPDGEYLLTVDGAPGGHESVRTTVELRGRRRELELRLGPFPFWRVKRLVLPPDQSAYLATAQHVREVTAELAAGAIRAPTGEPTSIYVQADVHDDTVAPRTYTHLPFSPPVIGDPPVRVAPLAEMPLDVRLLDGEGRPTEGKLRWEPLAGYVFPDTGPEWQSRDGLLSLGVPRWPGITLSVVPTNTTLVPCMRTLAWPTSGDDSSDDANVVQLATRVSNAVELHLPSGVAIEEVEFRVVSPAGVIRSVDPDDLVSGQFPWPLGGSVLSARTDGHAPLYSRLAPRGPWTVRWPSGSLEIELPAHVRLLSSVAIVGGHRLTFQDGAVAIGGLEPGSYEVLIYSDDGTGLLTTVALAKGEARVIAVPDTRLR